MSMVVETAFEFPCALIRAIQLQAQSWHGKSSNAKMMHDCESAIHHLNAAYTTICMEDREFHSRIRNEFLSSGIDTEAETIVLYDEDINAVMTAWLEAACCLQQIATRLIENRLVVHGLSDLQTNMEEFLAALNPSYELSGEMLELAIEAHEEFKRGETVAGWPEVEWANHE